MTCLSCHSKFLTKLRLKFSLLIQNPVLPARSAVKTRGKGQAAVSMKRLPALLCLCCKAQSPGGDSGFPGGTVVKNPPANAAVTGDPGSVPGLGRSPEVGNGNLLQYTCLENPMDRGAWQTRVHGVAKSQPQLSTHKSKKKGGLDFKRIHTCYSLRWDPSNDTL